MTWKKEKKVFEKEIRPGGRRAETPKKTADKLRDSGGMVYLRVVLGYSSIALEKLHFDIEANYMKYIHRSDGCRRGSFLGSSEVWLCNFLSTSDCGLNGFDADCKHSNKPSHAIADADDECQSRCTAVSVLGNGSSSTTASNAQFDVFPWNFHRGLANHPWSTDRRATEARYIFQRHSPEVWRQIKGGRLSTMMKTIYQRTEVLFGSK